MKHTVSQLKLDSGAEGLLINVPDASVMTFELSFRAGEYLVEDSKWETPHLMEHLLLGANQFIPKARAFQAEFEKNGAYNNASTNAYDITYEAECADFEWERILHLLLVSISKPLFLEDEFVAESGNVKEELASRSNNHFRYLSLALKEKYGYVAKTDQERLKLMKNVKLADIWDHYNKTHTLTNLRFVIAGKITPNRQKIVKALIESLDLPKGSGRPKLPHEVPKKLTSPLFIKNTSVDTVYFYIDSFLKRKLTDTEADALGLANTMLTETLYSKILGTARERGLVYGMNSGYGQSYKSSNWWFGTQVMQENIGPLFEIIKEELTKVFNGELANDDVAEAKQYSLGRFQRSAQTVAGIMSGYSNRYFFDGVIEDYYQVPDRIKKIEKDTIIAVSRAMFEDGIWGLGILGNINEEVALELRNQLKSLWRLK
ncbi:MAG: insulinase family protein [bacterium]|jgi:predicted Zn-dependent peptidase